MLLGCLTANLQISWKMQSVIPLLTEKDLQRLKMAVPAMQGFKKGNTAGYFEVTLMPSKSDLLF